MSAIDVSCDAVIDGWRCRVRVSEGGSTFDHDVSIDGLGPFLPSVLPYPGFTDMERLIRETFAFLLEHEPPSAILRTFTLSDVSRYFPEYPAAIRLRLAP